MRTDGNAVITSGVTTPRHVIHNTAASAARPITYWGVWQSSSASSKPAARSISRSTSYGSSGG
jgi:hypothetical protein